MMRMPARRPVLLLLLAPTALVLGCADAPSAPTISAPEDAEYAKPGWAEGGKKDSGGATLAVSGGMTAEAQTVTVKEQSGSLQAEAGGYTASLGLGSAFTGSLESPAPCLFEPLDADDSVKQSLVDHLSAHGTGELTVLIDKGAVAAGTTSSDHMLKLGMKEGLFQIGRNNDRIEAGFPKVSSTTDGGIRTFTFLAGFGDVRVAQRYDGNGDGKLKANDPVAHLFCPLNMDVTATLDETGG